MNDLSWMLYWADMVPSLGRFCGIVGLGFLLTRALWFARNAWLEDFASGRGIGPAPKWLIPVALGLMLTATILPSRDTFYAIAASEMGEEALQSPIATKAGKALEKWLDDQLADETKGE